MMVQIHTALHLQCHVSYMLSNNKSYLSQQILENPILGVVTKITARSLMQSSKDKIS